MTNLRLVTEAAAFAASAHAKARRKGDEDVPFINHPITVANLVASAGFEAEVVAAALLHDVVEDTVTTIEQIERWFGPVVAQYVGEVTDDKTRPWQERKDLQALAARDLSDGAAAIRIADKIANLRDLRTMPPAWPSARKAQYRYWCFSVVERANRPACDVLITIFLAENPRA